MDESVKQTMTFGRLKSNKIKLLKLNAVVLKSLHLKLKLFSCCIKFFRDVCFVHHGNS